MGQGPLFFNGMQNLSMSIINEPLARPFATRVFLGHLPWLFMEPWWVLKQLESKRREQMLKFCNSLPVCFRNKAQTVEKTGALFSLQ